MQSGVAPAGIRIEVEHSDDVGGAVGGCCEEAAVAPRRCDVGAGGSGRRQLSPPTRSRRSRSLPSVHDNVAADQLQQRLRELSLQQSHIVQNLPQPAQKLAIDTMPLPVENNRQRRKSFDFAALQNLGAIQEQD